MVLTGASKHDVVERLKLFDQLRVERVKRVIEYTRLSAPVRVQDKDAKKLDHKSTQTFSDYYWSYFCTQDSVRVMNDAGHKMTVVDEKTGELSL